MKKLIVTSILSMILFNSFGQKDTLFRVNDGLYELGVPCGYVNQKGDTIIPIGKYFYCFTDTIIDFGIVKKTGEQIIAIDQNEKILFEVLWYDMGPDRIQNDRFRIIKDDKVGYANSKGEIIIEPQFQCTFPFNDGIAKVAYNCNIGEPDSEGHRIMTSDEWFYSDVNGNKINNKP